MGVRHGCAKILTELMKRGSSNFELTSNAATLKLEIVLSFSHHEAVITTLSVLSPLHLKVSKEFELNRNITRDQSTWCFCGDFFLVSELR